MADKEPLIIIVHETVMDSVLCDIGTFSCLTLCTGVGYVLGIPALEWIGGLFFVVMFTSRMITLGYKHRYTPEQAQARLDEIKKSIKGK